MARVRARSAAKQQRVNARGSARRARRWQLNGAGLILRRMRGQSLVKRNGVEKQRSLVRRS